MVHVLVKDTSSAGFLAWCVPVPEIPNLHQQICLGSSKMPCLNNEYCKHWKEWPPEVATKPFPEKSVIRYQMIFTSWKEICVSTLYRHKEPSTGHTQKISQAETSPDPILWYKLVKVLRRLIRSFRLVEFGLAKCVQLAVFYSIKRVSTVCENRIN